jgi:hypothetical protein
MDASNRVRKQPAGRGAPRRPDCSPPRVGGTADPRPEEGLTVAIRATPLPDPQTNPLRARQLAVIVNLLRRAAAEAAERDATSCDAARPPG